VRDAESLEAARRKIGHDTLAVRGDVRDLEHLEQFFAEIQTKFGALDVLFVNAGLARMGSIAEVSEADFDEIMNINFKGAFFTVQKALRVMRDGGSIVLNGSVNAHAGFGGVSVYSASKAALHSLARTLTPELTGRGIRINTLTIGPVETPLYGKLGLSAEAVQGFAGAVGAKMPLGRFGKPEEIARAALFLASSDASFVLGSEMTVDGGLLVNAL
jgi:NAD(P)-dependent dehydrogenase (short-subunit alcohol dehydrogenase family)